MFVLAFVLYWAGAFAVIVRGNIPLNELLDKTDLESKSSEEMKTLRTQIEAKWNRLNIIRSISSGVTFLLLIISFLLLNK